MKDTEHPIESHCFLLPAFRFTVSAFSIPVLPRIQSRHRILLDEINPLLSGTTPITTRMVITKLTMLTNKIKRFFLKYMYKDTCLFFIFTHSFQNNFFIPLFVTIILCHTILHVVCKNMSKKCKSFNFIYADNFSRLIPAICSIGTL